MSEVPLHGFSMAGMPGDEAVMRSVFLYKGYAKLRPHTATRKVNCF